MRFEQKVALVTGAATGIGRASAVRLASEGARVGLADVNREALAETADLIEKAGGQSLVLRTDVSQESDVREAIASLVGEWGRLDVLFNNAGLPLAKPIVETTLEDFERLMAVNLRGVFLGCKYGIQQMLAQQSGGAIVNTASVVGTVGAPNQAVYSASKGAVVLMTKSLAVEYAKAGIRVNCVCPGATETPLFASVMEQASQAFGSREKAVESWQQRYAGLRLGRVEEMAAAVAFLASDEASFVNGHAFVVDGGMSAQ